MNYDERTMAAYLTDMMDGKVAAEATAREAAMAALNEAVEDALIINGTYTGQLNVNIGQGPDTVIDLGFRPRAVLVCANVVNMKLTGLALDGVDSTICLTITDTGFTARAELNYVGGTNSSSYNPYRYIAWK